MSQRWQRIASVARLEWQTQRREPLSMLYALTLGALAMAFAAAGPVELVRSRGEIPRDAAWSLTLAGTALAAFGQVITTMVAATVVLRDRADRVYELLVATPLTQREYLTGKLIAALSVLIVVYAAIPLGLVIGAALGGGSVVAAIGATVPAYFLIIVPTMLAVGAVQFAVGVLSGRLWVIVAQGLLLIWLWTACIDVSGGGSPVALAAWLDPFASAPVLQATRAWTDAQRATLPLPMTRALIGGRVGWLLVGATVAAYAICRGPAVRRTSGRQTDEAAVSVNPTSVRSPLARGAPVSVAHGLLETALYVTRWMMRDTGWRVLALLGAVNVTIYAVIDAPQGADRTALADAALLAVLTHARLFLILVATIYAGEVVWRERDERSAAFFDTLPLAEWAQFWGRALGVMLTQVVLVAALSSAAALGVLLATGGSLETMRFTLTVARQVLAPFVVWMFLALAVQVWVQQKLVAHLVTIAVWVCGVVFLGAAAADIQTAWSQDALLLAGGVAGVVAAVGWRRGRTGSWRG